MLPVQRHHDGKEPVRVLQTGLLYPSPRYKIPMPSNLGIPNLGSRLLLSTRKFWIVPHPPRTGLRTEYLHRLAINTHPAPGKHAISSLVGIGRLVMHSARTSRIVTRSFGVSHTRTRVAINNLAEVSHPATSKIDLISRLVISRIAPIRHPGISNIGIGTTGTVNRLGINIRGDRSTKVPHREGPDQTVLLVAMDVPHPKAEEVPVRHDLNQEEEDRPETGARRRETPRQAVRLRLPHHQRNVLVSIRRKRLVRSKTGPTKGKLRNCPHGTIAGPAKKPSISAGKRTRCRNCPA